MPQKRHFSAISKTGVFYYYKPGFSGQEATKAHTTRLYGFSGWGGGVRPTGREACIPPIQKPPFLELNNPPFEKTETNIQEQEKEKENIYIVGCCRQHGLVEQGIGYEHHLRVFLLVRPRLNMPRKGDV